MTGKEERKERSEEKESNWQDNGDVAEGEMKTQDVEEEGV